MKVELAPEIEDYSKHFTEMFTLRMGIRPTKEQALAAFIQSLAQTGDLIVEMKDSETVVITAHSFQE
jgi:hypothetical protein